MTQWHSGSAPKMPRRTMRVFTRSSRQYLASEKALHPELAVRYIVRASVFGPALVEARVGSDAPVSP
jgi:hypothetical protein